MNPSDSSLLVGRFRRVCESAPPLDLEWEPESIEPDLADMPVGRFRRVCKSAPPLDLEWEPADPALVLTLEFRPNADPAAVGADVSDLLLRLGRLDQSLGGAGFVRESEPGDVATGTIRLVLIPVNPHDAADRLRAVAEDARLALQAAATLVRFAAEVRIAA